MDRSLFSPDFDTNENLWNILEREMYKDGNLFATQEY